MGRGSRYEVKFGIYATVLPCDGATPSPNPLPQGEWENYTWACAYPDDAMSEGLFRPRRRPALRLALVLVASGVLLFAAVTVIWLRTHVVPPDCGDPDTLALVRQSLTERFRLPASVTIENIQTLAGGYVAFRFVCEAALGGIDRNALPDGSAIPGSVHYVSQLMADRRTQEVTVSIQPVLIWERVQ